MKIEIEKDWCLDAAEREDGCEVSAGDPLGPLMALRLKLTGSQKDVERLKTVINGQADDIENRIEEFGIMSAEISRLTTENTWLKQHCQTVIDDCCKAELERDALTAEVSRLEWMLDYIPKKEREQAEWSWERYTSASGKQEWCSCDPGKCKGGEYHSCRQNSPCKALGEDDGS